MKKKVVLCMVAVLTVVSLAGCGSNKKTVNAADTAKTEEEEGGSLAEKLEDAVNAVGQDVDTSVEETAAPEETTEEASDNGEAAETAEEQTNAVISTDSKYQMAFPTDWIQATGELNESFTMEMVSGSQDYAVMAISEPSQDLDMDLAQYTDTLVGMTQEGLTNAVSGDKQEMAIGNYTGYCTRLEGTVESINLVYFIYTVQTDTDFYQILGWSAASEADNAKPVFDQIVSTFQLL